MIDYHRYGYVGCHQTHVQQLKGMMISVYCVRIFSMNYISHFRGAYFATRAKKGLKIISLNTNFCNTQNWWVLLNATDPGQQLEWLIQQLTESERLGEMVCLPD